MYSNIHFDYFVINMLNFHGILWVVHTFINSLIKNLLKFHMGLNLK